MTTSITRTVFVLHTSFALVDLLNKMLEEAIPEARIVNIVDDSLLADVRAAGHATPSVTRRMVGYAQLAQSAGADAIFNSCSSVGEVADVIQQVVDIPVVKIDECMAEEAVRLGRRIAVIATVPTTLPPTARLIEHKAEESGKVIEVNRHLVEGAFDVLMSGDLQKHDEMVGSEIRQAAGNSDVVILAQATMARIVPSLGDLPSPILSSPSGGIARLAQVLAQG